MSSNGSNLSGSRHSLHAAKLDFLPCTDEELHRAGTSELVRRFRVLESEHLRLAREHTMKMKEVNEKFQIHLSEIRHLREVNKRMLDENQEMRDLCCFLDDDRQRARKIAKEWQQFGHYTSSIMHEEVSNYQKKLRELESQQENLMRDNVELRDLCLYLDEERRRRAGDDDATSTYDNIVLPASFASAASGVQYSDSILDASGERRSSEDYDGEVSLDGAKVPLRNGGSTCSSATLTGVDTITQSANARDDTLPDLSSLSSGGEEDCV